MKEFKNYKTEELIDQIKRNLKYWSSDSLLEKTYRMQQEVRVRKLKELGI